jgi:hypothetical protein
LLDRPLPSDVRGCLAIHARDWFYGENPRRGRIPSFMGLLCDVGSFSICYLCGLLFNYLTPIEKNSQMLLPDGRAALCSSSRIAGWSSPVARQAHNLKAAGSNPAPATNFEMKALPYGRAFVLGQVGLPASFSFCGILFVWRVNRVCLCPSIDFIGVTWEELINGGSGDPRPTIAGGSGA